ncbi:hypothetical protein HGRIS_006308 [Hohenbuehelia grisea]|uniref:F-box domain-containing protein n=1 Tax=Hohenbuehelia grisea TaxID=104357 RepID=A0ABR3K284_9AGAR
MLEGSPSGPEDIVFSGAGPLAMFQYGPLRCIPDFVSDSEATRLPHGKRVPAPRLYRIDTNAHSLPVVSPIMESHRLDTMDIQLAVIQFAFAMLTPLALLFIISNCVESPHRGKVAYAASHVQRRANYDRPTPASTRRSYLTSLPNELLLEILIHATTTAPERSFHNLLLVSRRVQHVAYAARLSYHTIKLASSRPLKSFHRWVKAHPDLATRARHLSIAPTMPLSIHEVQLCSEVIVACSGLVSLRCHSRVLEVAFRRYRHPFAHLRLVRLTLTVAEEGHWERLKETTHGWRLTKQLTHSVVR